MQPLTPPPPRAARLVPLVLLAGLFAVMATQESTRRCLPCAIPGLLCPAPGACAAPTNAPVLDAPAHP